MDSIVRHIFAACFPKNKKRSAESIIIDDLFFVIPQEDIERFMSIQAEDDYVSLREFMLLYYYAINEDYLQPPGENYQRKQYFFQDGNRTFILKGWVPSVACSNVRGDNAIASGIESILRPAAYSVSEYSVHNRYVVSQIRVKPLENSYLNNPRASCLHLPPLSSSSSLVAQNGMLDTHVDVSADIEALLHEPQQTEHARSRPERPKAAKGPRTKPNSKFQCDESKQVEPHLTRNALFEPARKIRPRQERPKAARGARTQPNRMIQY
ncbi:hypothetical protein ACF0H5_012333 [Mactra antiquata]